MDKAIIQLIKKLKHRNKSDLAKLLIGCRSRIEETDQYGSYWKKFLSCFIIYAPTEKYQRLQKICQEDRDVILQCVLELYPKNEELEIGFLDFKILPNEKEIKRNIRLAYSWLERSGNKLSEGKALLKKFKYPEAISSFQECIELSLKSLSLLLTDRYSKEHKFDEKEFEEILTKIPESLENLEFYKLYLYSKFWSNFYIVAKYGLEKFGIGPEKLFGENEANLAEKHAEKCYFTSLQLKNYLENPW
jgi:HEPN domain-containing protein